jgi:NADH-quinone oxidoreductase subunit F
VAEDLVYADPVSGARIARAADIPFYRRQQRTVLGPNRWLDPGDIEDYVRGGSYAALARVLSGMRPEEVIAAVGAAGLRGRGGAGFPTGAKWEAARRAGGAPKWVVVNCDEGDPGAYMDRSLMEGNPHAVLEGLAIGAYAVGARGGVMYVRWEYPLATRNADRAIVQAREYGLLGERVLGTDFAFDVRVHRGAGAFVSGEETAMLAAIEGRPGKPSLKYVYPAERGLHGKPTVINNVETWANVPLIVERGPTWFGSLGTARSKGTKIFSLVGKVNNTGLVEVPMGMTLRELVYDVGGGIPRGRRFKALQIGGPSGGIVGEEALDTPVDFEALTAIGAMMGSGGIVVMDDTTCVVAAVRDLVAFCHDEVCGKCVPGREGMRLLRGWMDDICAGRADASVLARVPDVTEVMREASLCALCVTATNPVQTSLRYFSAEYAAHVEGRRCPAKVCPDLLEYRISAQKCDVACTACLQNCPTEGAILGRKGTRKQIDQEKCVKCGVCIEVCPTRFTAVAKFSGEPVPKAFRTVPA